VNGGLLLSASDLQLRAETNIMLAQRRSSGAELTPERGDGRSAGRTSGALGRFPLMGPAAVLWSGEQAAFTTEAYRPDV
jgi:hypothetical protein